MSAEIFSNIHNGPFRRYLLLSKNIGQDVKNQSEIVNLAFLAEYRYLQYSENFRKPSSISIFVNPILHQIEKAVQYACTDPILGDHITVVAQSVKALLWVQEKDPVLYLEEVLAEARTYTDIVLVFFKDKDLHVEWVEAWLETLNEVNNFVRRRYPKGITWKGELDVPSYGSLEELTEFEALNTTSLYHEINKGQTIQEALRQLNSPNAIHGEQKHQETALPGTVLIKEGKKWKIEHQRGTTKHITINDAEPDNVLYIYDCKSITLIVERKMNVIKVDNCEKMSIIFRSLISGIELISCKDLKLHAFGTLPSISVDSCDDINIHLTKKGLDAQVMTSQCSKISLSYPMGDGYYKTFCIPSRLMTTINPEQGLKTLPVVDE